MICFKIPWYVILFVFLQSQVKQIYIIRFIACHNWMNYTNILYSFIQYVNYYIWKPENSRIKVLPKNSRTEAFLPLYGCIFVFILSFIRLPWSSEFRYLSPSFHPCPGGPHIPAAGSGHRRKPDSGFRDYDHDACHQQYDPRQQNTPDWGHHLYFRQRRYAVHGQQPAAAVQGRKNHRRNSAAVLHESGNTAEKTIAQNKSSQAPHSCGAWLLLRAERGQLCWHFLCTRVWNISISF